MLKRIIAASFLLLAAGQAVASPWGWLDSADSSAVSGWACDGGNFAAALTVEVSDQFGLVGTAVAANYRGDLAQANVCGGTGAHGYTYYLSSSNRNLRDNLTHQFQVVAIGVDGTRQILSGSPKSVFMPGDSAAYGWLDTANSDFAYGWACDIDNTNASLGVRISDSAGVIGYTTANVYRPDLVGVCGSVYHGYYFSWTQGQRNVRDNQYHQIVAEAQDSETGQWIVLSGSPQTVFIPGPVTTYSISGRTGSPGVTVSAGAFSAITDSVGAYTISGVSQGAYQVTVSGIRSGCNISPAAINVAVGPDAPNTNFVTQCNKNWDPGLQHNAHSYYGKQFSTSAPGTEVTWQYVPEVRTSPAQNWWMLSSFNEIPVPAGVVNGVSFPDYPTWPVSSTPYSDLYRVMSTSFDSVGGVCCTVTIGLDKTNDANNIPLVPQGNGRLGSSAVGIIPSYTTAFLEDNYDVNNAAGTPYPRLGEDLYIDLRAAVTSHSVPSAARPLPPLGFLTNAPYSPFPNVSGMSRLTVGINARDNLTGSTLTVEVVLWRDAAYDGCGASNLAWWGTQIEAFNVPGWSCDGLGGYDRRVYYGSGELVYFYGPQIAFTGVSGNLPSLAVGGGSNFFTIPVTALYKYYFNHPSGQGFADSSAPSDWGNVQILGVYMGIESWGKAATTIQLSQYRLYSITR